MKLSAPIVLAQDHRCAAHVGRSKRSPPSPARFPVTGEIAKTSFKEGLAFCIAHQGAT